jgi:hypothetical protein
VGLGAFLAELDERLQALGPTGVRSSLHAAAARLSPSERPAFLAIFEADALARSDDLVEEIDAFVADLPALVDEYDATRRGHGRRWDRWDDEDDSPMVEEVDDLYRRLGERFLAGDWQIAVDGYRRLLGAATADIDSPDGALVGGSDELVREGMIRLVRALLADRTVAPSQRAAHVVDVMVDFGSVGGHPRLGEVLSAHPAPIDDIDEVLAALGALCEERARASSAWDGAPFHNLALDVTVERDGPDALARLARDRTMPRRERVWERWMTELAATDRLTDSIAVGVEAIGSIAPGHDRARLADQLGGLQRRAGASDRALSTAVIAFNDAPSLRRLRLILDDADAVEQPAPLESLVLPAGSDPMVRAATRLLAGAVDDIASAAAIDPGRPSPTLDATAVIVAGLLRTSAMPTGGHVERCDQLLAGLDRVWPGRGVSLELGRVADSEPDDEPSPLGPRVIGVLEHVAPDTRRVTVAAEVIEAAAAEVMSNKWRSSYGLVARMVVALASATEASGRGPATTVVAEYDHTYRRFTAFRKELASAASGDRLRRSKR